jgi:hypoxanthine phosphoribosyltransferase
VKSWDEFKADTKELAETIAGSSVHPTLIIALSRGGFVPGLLLSNFLGVKRLTSIGIGYSGAERATPVLYSLPSPLEPDESVLLVEDCLESGKSLRTAKALIEPRVKNVYTCSVYKITRTGFTADYTHETFADPPVLPWE